MIQLKLYVLEMTRSVALNINFCIENVSYIRIYFYTNLFTKSINIYKYLQNIYFQILEVHINTIHL